MTALKSMACKLLLLVFSSLFFTPVFAENLLQVYQQALKNDAQIRASEAGYLAVLEKRPQALSALKPRIDLGGSATYNLQQIERTGLRDGGSAFLNFGYNLNLTKPLIHKEIQAQIGQVNATILQAKANLERDRQNLIIRVAEAYFQYLKAKEGKIFATAEKKAIARQLNQVKAFFDAGRSAITDVKEAQARYDQSKALEVVAQQQIDIAKESIKAITTRYYKHLAGVSSKTPLIVPKPNNIEQWTQTAIKNSLQVIAASHAVTAAQKAVDIARAAKSPTVDLFARHSGNTTQGESQFDQDKFDASIGIQFNMPLYRGGNISSRIREARHRLQQARQQLEAQKRVVAQQSRAAYTTIISGLAQIKAFKQALNSTQTAAKATQAGFEAGTRTAVDILLALRETFRSKRDYSTARYDFLLNTLKLRQAAGILSENDIAALSKLLR
ncbi:MAG TPA: type I secretion protein TolC [Leucothrix sp.]|nr:type I secretion protein TolC [Leucothrix sp.]